MKPAVASIAVSLIATVLSATPGFARHAPTSAEADSLKGGRAAVKSNGELAYGINIKDVTKTTTGKYTIRFRRNITGCYYSVTHAIVALSPASLASTLTIYPSSTSERELQVFAWSTKTSTYSDEPFMLEVTC